MSAVLKDKLINRLLQLAPFSGWSNATLEEAAKEEFNDKKQALILFSDGISQAVDHFAKGLDAAMEQHCRKPHFASLKIREKVKDALMFRFKHHQHHREAIRRLLTYYALPHHAPQATQNLFATCDKIWYLAGDKATDYNYYTKRAMLAGVYSSTLLAWLSDPTPDLRITEEFLDRRIGNVMQIEKAKAQLKDSAIGKWFAKRAG